jgi:hypothetical protein
MKGIKYVGYKDLVYKREFSGEDFFRLFTLFEYLILYTFQVDRYENTISIDTVLDYLKNNHPGVLINQTVGLLLSNFFVTNNNKDINKISLEKLGIIEVYPGGSIFKYASAYQNLDARRIIDKFYGLLLDKLFPAVSGWDFTKFNRLDFKIIMACWFCKHGNEFKAEDLIAPLGINNDIFNYKIKALVLGDNSTASILEQVEVLARTANNGYRFNPTYFISCTNYLTYIENFYSTMLRSLKTTFPFKPINYTSDRYQYTNINEKLAFNYDDITINSEVLIEQLLKQGSTTKSADRQTNITLIELKNIFITHYNKTQMALANDALVRLKPLISDNACPKVAVTMLVDALKASNQLLITMEQATNLFLKCYEDICTMMQKSASRKKAKTQFFTPSPQLQVQAVIDPFCPEQKTEQERQYEIEKRQLSDDPFSPLCISNQSNRMT